MIPMKRLLLLLLLSAMLIPPITGLRADERLVWKDPLEFPQLADLDVREVEVLRPADNPKELHVAIRTYGEIPPPEKGGSVAIAVYVAKQEEGQRLYLHHAAAWYMIERDGRVEKECNFIPYDPAQEEWDKDKAEPCELSVSNELIRIRINLPDVLSDGKLVVKSRVVIVAVDFLPVTPYTITGDSNIKLDGILDKDYGSIPKILDERGDAPSYADVSEIFVADDGVSAYLAIPVVGGLECDPRGYGAVVYIHHLFGVDLDGDPNVTESLFHGVRYCDAYGEIVERKNVPPYLAKRIAIKDLLEGAVELKGKRKGETVNIVAEVKVGISDEVPDAGWMILGSGLLLGDFEVNGPKVDLNMNEDLRDLFKSFGEARGLKRIILGGPAVNPSYEAPFKFLKDKDGIYKWLEVGGTKYRAVWGKEDYAVVSVRKVGAGYVITVAGITRYGTRAGLLWLRDHIGMIGIGDYVITWFDDGDGSVEPEEVGILPPRQPLSHRPSG